jgi:P4 family phage/plasmid primase-like protien
MNMQDELDLAKKLIEILDQKRAEDRGDWIEIGWTLYNISDGCREGLDIWIDFSKRCAEKFYESVCINEWEKMTKKSLTIGTLKYLAKIDNPDEYKKIIRDRTKKFVKLEGTHNDIAEMLYELVGDEFVCGSTEFKTWYRYVGHSWKQDEKGISLRKMISTEIVLFYSDFLHEIVNNISKCEDESDLKKYQHQQKIVGKLITNLKSAPFKDNVMKEAMERFFKEDFCSRLDSNPYLVCFKNGVYDLKTGNFRPGRPDDYISMSAGVDYKEFNDVDDQVEQVHRFLEKVFPDSDVRKYFLDTTSDVFIGGNLRKLAIFWSGEGDNGKSITQILVEKMLGKYAIKLPTSLITGKRTQSSSACPELVRAGNGVRWAILQEPDKKDKINIGLLKELTGNDSFYARGLYSKGAEITPMFKTVIICNDPPELPYDDKAAWNRIRVIPFEATFTDICPDTFEEQLKQKRFPKDPEFASKIPDMIEAFAWVLLEHRKNNYSKVLVEPEKVRLATNNYRKKNDLYRQFIEDTIISDKIGTISIIELYSVFKDWFKDNYPGRTISEKQDVKEYFVRLWGDFNKGTSWNGYRFKTQMDENINEEGVEFELKEEHLDNQ